MATARKIQRKPKVSDEDLQKMVEEYRNAKAAAEQFQKRASQYRDLLMEAVLAQGYEDEKGNRWLEAGDTKVKRERRTSRALDTTQASDFFRNKGLWEDVMEVVEVFSEDKMWALVWDKKVPERTVNGFYTETETWALRVL